MPPPQFDFFGFCIDGRPMSNLTSRHKRDRYPEFQVELIEPNS
jgi:hypothetical protein